ncbi:uncharacterized protein NECHADRAFT_85066 [Fusarium vanettenii 77-13-4]|uniref:F-box domain-containing protein n=1 Tax=Fusarium vanettenii (strain ATCC MYA-4622 / CBS 123669 / FGSC 9596 / NRRL 45880 / 77-13-4) TaxID=660122 RepID=C7YUW7_FUSV7|nr:uncharacterized protein NECHADRAFT_85066 [Fusarium vanettenii 77-13-4]EEU44480.1 hypothetical protein NECHADRAFT_85066 [Fusarium vanettenii 77-13-4]
MLFLLTVVSFLSFASANFLFKGKPIGDPTYNSAKYHWECGKIRALGNTTDGTFKLNWWPARTWDHKSCRALLHVKELPTNGLKLHAEELVKVARWGADALCGGTWQRSMYPMCQRPYITPPANAEQEPHGDIWRPAAYSCQTGAHGKQEKTIHKGIQCLGDQAQKSFPSRRNQTLPLKHLHLLHPPTHDSSPSGFIMDEEPNNGSAFLAKIPIDIISHTLSFLPDRKSLLNSILTCRDFHNAYNLCKTYIASTIFIRSMPQSVYEEAAIYYHLTREQWHGARAGIQAINRVFAKKRTLDEGQLPVNQRMTIKDIKTMHIFHDNAGWWANRIATNLKRDHPVLSGHTSPFQLTPTVLNRFKRAIYRLYIAFFSHFSTVEAEQTINVCELLVAEIAPSLNRFIDQDIGLGGLVPGYVDCAAADMPMVVQGLGLMRDFINARTYNQRYTLMQTVNPDDWRPERSVRPRFPLGDLQLHYDFHHCGLAPEDLKELINEPHPLWVSRVPFYDDGDIGPQWAWRKFNARAALFGGEFYQTMYVARPWGYTFWDYHMLDAGNIIRLNEDATRDLMPTLGPGHKIFTIWCPFLQWRTVEACRKVRLAYYVKAALRAWGSIGWFDADNFPPDYLVSELMTIFMIQLTEDEEDEEEDMAFMALLTYAYEYSLHHDICLVAPDE